MLLVVEHFGKERASSSSSALLIYPFFSKKCLTTRSIAYTKTDIFQGRLEELVLFSSIMDKVGGLNFVGSFRMNLQEGHKLYTVYSNLLILFPIQERQCMFYIFGLV